MSRKEHNNAYKEILAVYRDGDEKRYADDFAEALQAMENDQELETRFNEDQAFDAEFRAALADLEVPEQKPLEEPQTETRPIPFIRFAAAAIVIIALSLFGLLRFDAAQHAKAEIRVDAFRQHVAAFAASPDFGLDLMDNDLSKLRELNMSKGGLYGEAMDKVFANGLPMGCKVLDWDGVKISLYCFGNGQNQVVHCFVLPLDQLNGKRAAEHLKEIIAHSDRDTGGFIADDTAYLLVSSMPGVDIKPFLLPAQEQFALIIPASEMAILAFEISN